MDPNPAPGAVATPPVAEPAAPASPAAAPAQDPTPTGSEPVINSGNGGEQTVPFSRFQEVNDKVKLAEEEAETLRQQLADSKSADDDVELEADTEKLLDSYAKKRGLISKEELAAEQNKVQVQQDISDLTANPPNPGIPYDNKSVMDYAKSNNLPITSKAALRAAYRDMNYDKIMEAERQKSIEAYKTSGASGAERAGSTGAEPPQEPELKGKTTKERTRERIRNASQKIT